jgi:hypothetical protein
VLAKDSVSVPVIHCHVVEPLVIEFSPEKLFTRVSGDEALATPDDEPNAKADIASSPVAAVVKRIFVILVRLSGLRYEGREVPNSETGLVVIALALSWRLARMSSGIAGAAHRHGRPGVTAVFAAVMVRDVHRVVQQQTASDGWSGG